MARSAQQSAGCARPPALRSSSCAHHRLWRHPGASTQLPPARSHRQLSPRPARSPPGQGALRGPGRPTDGAPKWRAWRVGPKRSRRMSALGAAARRPFPAGREAALEIGERRPAVGVHGPARRCGGRQLRGRRWAMRAMLAAPATASCSPRPHRCCHPRRLRLASSLVLHHRGEAARGAGARVRWRREGGEKTSRPLSQPRIRLPLRADTAPPGHCPTPHLHGSDSRCGRSGRAQPQCVPPARPAFRPASPAAGGTRPRL